jgi:hypothetical protein
MSINHAAGSEEQPVMIEAALAFVQARLEVFPLHGLVNGVCTCQKANCSSPGKHPLTPKGFKDASSDPAIIAAWWKRWPFANIGLPTGGPLHLLVIDCDPRNGGPTTFGELKGLFPSLPAGSIRVRTGGGGLHVYLRYSGGPLPKELAKGIDLKGDGGYVVAPPSLHASGRRYAFEAEGAEGL